MSPTRGRRPFLASDEASQAQAAATAEGDAAVPASEAAIDTRLAVALEHIDGAFVILDRTWCFTFVNHNAVRPIELAPVDVMGRNLWEMFPEFRDTETAKHYQQVMEHRQPARFEDRSPVNGRWYEVSVYPVPEGVAAHWHDITERKRAELALAESEERARVTAEAALTGLFDWEPTTGRMYWSDQNYRTLGLEPGTVEPSYAAWAAHVHPDDLPQVEALVRAAQAERRPYHGVHRVKWPDGSIHVMEARAQFSFDETGTCVRMRGTYVDITERALAEQSLRESESRFRAMANDAPLPIWVTDAGGGVQFINQSYRTFFGVPAADPSAVDWRSFVHPDDRAYVDAFEESVRSRTPFRAEARLRRSDGSWRWIASHGVPRWTDDGTFLGFVGTSADVTERRWLEEQERAASVQAHFRSLFESLPGPYVVLTPDDFRIVAVSDAYLEATGSTRAALIDKPVFQAFADDGAYAETFESLRASLRRVVADGRVDVVPVSRLPVRRPESIGGGIEERWWSPVSAPVFGPDGRVGFVIHRAEDVTAYVAAIGDSARAPSTMNEQRWAAEVVQRAQELHQANERLRGEMEQRRHLEEQRTLLMRQLVVAQEAERRRIAQELHDGMGQYLTALTFGLESLMNIASAAPGMHSGLQRMQALARTLDDEVDRIAADLRPVLLDDLGLEDALRRHVRLWAQETGVAADIHTRGLENRLPVVTETTVYRIVQEALTNVHKHARATGASVVVERRGSELIAVIEDNGVGFPGTGTTNSPGAKLGLSTMRERAALAGGDLQVESSSTAGTSVFFRVPVRD